MEWLAAGVGFAETFPTLSVSSLRCTKVCYIKYFGSLTPYYVFWQILMVNSWSSSRIWPWIGRWTEKVRERKGAALRLKVVLNQCRSARRTTGADKLAYQLVSISSVMAWPDPSGSCKKTVENPTAGLFSLTKNKGR